MNSMSKLGFDELAGGVFQFEMDPALLGIEDDPGRLLADLASTYFIKGGVHVFVNIVSIETLEDAMKNPELHEDLVVRVTGYSVHFVQLDKAIQQEIIARTRFKE